MEWLTRVDAERLIVRGLFQDVLGGFELEPVRVALAGRIPQSYNRLVPLVARRRSPRRAGPHN